LTVSGKHRFTESHVPEEGVQRCETVISCPGAIASLDFEVLQKLAEEGGVEFFQAKFGWLPSEALRGETEQQAKSVPVAGDRVWAGAELSEQPVRKEALEEGREAVGGHRAPPRFRTIRCSVASWRSSGTASMYQYVWPTWTCPR
jgi:hypothetical protein